MLLFLKKDAGDIFFEAVSKPQKYYIPFYKHREQAPKPQKVGSESILQAERFAISGHAIRVN